MSGRFLHMLILFWSIFTQQMVVAKMQIASTQDAAIVGKVLFQGTAPIMPMIHMRKEPFCTDAYKRKPQYEESVVVNPNKTLRDVVVFVKKGLVRKRFKVPPFTILDQANCWFKPHVLAVMVGQSIKAINDDPGVLHNFHFMTKINPPLNFSEPGEKRGGMIPSRTIIFHHSEMIPVLCDIHSWMRATVAVMESPYFSVTGEDGDFMISHLSAGTYIVEAWHEKYGRKDIEIALKKGEKRNIVFYYKASEMHK